MHYLIVMVIVFALSMMGCEGKTGPAGPTGAAGVAGPAGPTGPQGSTGPAGPQGPAGADGAQGPQGEPGPQGPAGADGADGAQGPQGEPGPAGPAGADGADGAQGPQGEPGPAGPMGPEGPQGPQGEIPDPGNILATIHTIKLVQDGDDDKTFSYGTPGFDNGGLSVHLIEGESTTLAAKALAPDGESMIPVEFSWASEDAEIASVDAGMITAHRNGMIDVTLTAVGRGIDIMIPVSVQNPVAKVVVMAATGVNLNNLVDGDTVLLMAKAYDADGDEVKDQTFVWSSSNTAVATVDKDTGLVTAVSAGEATIMASVGDVSSGDENSLTVTVFDVLQPMRQLLLDVASIPFTVTVDVDSTGAFTGPASQKLTLSAILEHKVNGEWEGATGKTVTFESIKPEILAFDKVTTPGADADGLAETMITLELADIKKLGEAVVKASAEYADPIYFNVIIKAAE